MQNINSSKYDDYVEKMMKKSSKSLDAAEDAGSKQIKKAYDDEFIEEITWDLMDNEIIKYKSIMTDSIALDDVMRTTLWTAMKEMGDAAEKAASTELARSLGYMALKESFSQILWKYTIRNGGLIDFDWGNGFAYDSSVSRQFSEKWWANQEWFGYELWDAGDLGLTETEDSDYWEDAYVEGDGTDDDDYWYVGMDDTSTGATSTESDEDDDDYWYGTGNDAGAAE
jgi:hypothetical protein